MRKERLSHLRQLRTVVSVVVVSVVVVSAVVVNVTEEGAIPPPPR